MARPKKIGLDYFPVDVNFNDQIQALESLHGNNGLVWILKFWQTAYKTEFGEVNLSGLFGSISANNARITPEQQDLIIKTCMELGLLHEVSPKVYASNGVQKRIGIVSRERQSAIVRHKKGLFGEQCPNNPQTIDEKEEKKLEESKVNEIKVKETPHCSANNPRTIPEQFNWPDFIAFWNSFSTLPVSPDDMVAEAEYKRQVFDYTHEQVMTAISNHKIALESPNSQAHKHSLIMFLRKHITSFLPAAFNLENYDKTKFEKDNGKTKRSINEQEWGDELIPT